MKIVSWNLKNIGLGKLNYLMNPAIAAAGYGGTMLAFMTKVVMGDPAWRGTDLSLVPADLLMVIELKTGGHLKGTAPTVNADLTMTAIRNAMHAHAVNTGQGAQYNYAWTSGLLTGNRECVGLVYNTVTLAFNNEQVLQNHNGNYILPRTPYMANFTHIASGVAFDVVGIHAPPPQSGAQRFRKPISFCIQLPSCPAVMGGPPGRFFIGGDFNCEPNDTVAIGGVNVLPFANAPPPPNRTLVGYVTNLPAGTRTSVRKKLDNNQVGVNRYLSGAYDNILRQTPGNFLQYTPDLIGNVNAVCGLLAKLNSFNKVSDHFPVVINDILVPQRIVVPPLPVNPPWQNWLGIAAQSSAGLPVVTAVTAGPAVWNGGMGAVVAHGPGLVTLTFNAAGNATYAAPPQVTRQVNFV